MIHGSTSAIGNSIIELRKELPTGTVLVAVSKTKTRNEIMQAYNAGQRDFGENKVQEITAKQEELPRDIRWHFIGHLQRNKVKYLVSFVYMIHSIDSAGLIEEIEKRASGRGRIINGLFQLGIAEEDSKFGFSERALLNYLEEGDYLNLKYVNPVGMMGMATNTDDFKKIGDEFRSLKQTFDKVKSQYFHNKADFNVLSMGMTGDYKIALREGSNTVRIGSLIFGERKP